MADRANFSPAIQRLIDAPGATSDALRADPTGFEAEALADDDSAGFADAALLNQQMLGFMLFDRRGARLPCSAPDWVPRVDNFADLELQAKYRSSRLMAVAADGQILHLLWAFVNETDGWNLPPAAREAAVSGKVDRVAIITGGSGHNGPIDLAASGFPLTGLERRVVVAIVQTGSARTAAKQLGLAYATVREAMASAAKRLRQPNMPAVVHMIVAAAFGILPNDAASPALLAAMLQLSDRQARIALLVVTGLSREATAAAVGISASVVRKELETIYANMGITSAAELSRLIIEVQALSTLARATDGAPGFLNPAVEPTHFAVRNTSRELIAWSDYGPASGKPVLMVHSNWSCREVPRVMVRALHARGWRPIAIDRPGFGATHLGRSSASDPFSQAIDDTRFILDLLRIRQISIIARAGAQFVHAIKSAAPDRVGPVVLVSPTVPTHASSQRKGLMGVMKDIFQQPRLVAFYFRHISRQMTIARLEQLTRAVAGSCAVDNALCDDSEFIRDRFRAVRPFATGNLVGGIYEQSLISNGSYDAAPLTVDDWAVIQGDDDNHNSFDDVQRHWSPILPSATFVKIPEGGRFLTSSHPEIIVDTLEALT